MHNTAPKMHDKVGKEIGGCLKRNLDVLSRRDPVLTERLADLKIQSPWVISHSENGQKTVRKHLGEEDLIYIHSRVSPKREAQQWAALVPDNAERFLVLGFGLGYHLLALQRKPYPKSLVIIEVDLELFQLAMKLINLTPMLRDSRVFLFIGDKISAIRDFLKNVSPSSISYREYLPSTSLHPEYYQRIKEMVEDYIHKNRLMSEPVLSQGIITLLDETKE